MEDIARNFVGLIFLVGADIIVVAVFIALAIANYLGCKNVFDFLGYDGLPLAREAFIGQVIGPFFPEATLSHFYAFVVASVISMGLFILFNRFLHIWELQRDRKGYLAQNDSESARILLSQIYGDIVLIITILPFLIAALMWDFDLFRYRSAYGALGIEDPSQAPLTVGNWDSQLAQYGHLFAWELASVGAFGYLGITGVACASLEFCFRRTTERFVILLSNIENIFQPNPLPPSPPPLEASPALTLYGYDTNRQPIHDPAVPVTYDASWNTVTFYGYDSDGYPAYDPRTTLAYDTEGKLLRSATGNNTASHQDHQHISERIKKGPSQNQDTVVTRTSDDSQGSLFDDDETFQSLGGRRNENAQLRDVIGMAGERVSLAEAMANSERYWVDPDSLDVWNRDYRRTLFPGTC